MRAVGLILMLALGITACETETRFFITDPSSTGLEAIEIQRVELRDTVFDECEFLVRVRNRTDRPVVVTLTYRLFDRRGRERESVVLRRRLEARERDDLIRDRAHEECDRVDRVELDLARSRAILL